MLTAPAPVASTESPAGEVEHCAPFVASKLPTSDIFPRHSTMLAWTNSGSSGSCSSPRTKGTRAFQQLAAAGCSSSAVSALCMQAARSALAGAA